jgi:hypothetical protein
MISRRIHGACNRIDSFSLALLFAACFLAPIGEAIAQDTEGSAPEGVSWFPAVPLHITAGVDLGYDDHVLGSNASTNSSGQGSFFARENLVLTYDRGRERTQVKLIGVGRFSQFFDAGTDDKAGTVTLSLKHNYSTRLSFYTSVYATYQPEPDFQSDVGPENVRSAFFDMRDIFSVTYHWLPRFATITSYTFHGVKYTQSSSIASFQDRVDNTFAEVFQFSLTRRTNLTGTYSFKSADYGTPATNSGTAATNSVTHSVLAGFDHHFTEHITLLATAGESFRFPQEGQSSTNPTFTTALNYLKGNHSLIWTTSYGFEESNVQNASSRITIRTGLILKYELTSQIGATARMFYHHDENEGGSTGTSSVGSQDSLDISLGLRYTINKKFAAHVDYQFTTQSSIQSNSGYSRNRYFAGFTYTY